MTNEQIKTLLVDFYKNIDDDTCTLFDFNMKHAILDNKGNLKSYISEKTIGIALYSVFNAINKTRKEEEKRLRTEKLNALHEKDEFFGEVGYKFKGHPLHVTLTRTASYETDFGTTFVWNMVNDEGNIIVWKSSCSPYGNVTIELNHKGEELRDYCRSNFNCSINEMRESHMNDERFATSIKYLDHLKEIQKAIENNIPISFDIVGGSIKEHKVYTDRNGVNYKQTMVTRCKIDNFTL